MTAKRTDLNHAEIRDGLRGCGFFVADTHEIGHGFPDLLATTRSGIVVLLEVKSKNGKLTKDEEDFKSRYPGPYGIVHDVPEAIWLLDYHEQIRKE